MDGKKPWQPTFVDFFLRLGKENIKWRKMLVWLKTKAKLVLKPGLSWHFFLMSAKDNKMKHQENITSHNHYCDYIRLSKYSLMKMCNKYRNKHREKIKCHVSLGSTALKTICVVYQLFRRDFPTTMTKYFTNLNQLLTLWMIWGNISLWMWEIIESREWAEVKEWHR